MLTVDFKEITYRYNGGEAIHETEIGSYAGDSQEELEFVCWNHGLEQVINSLLKQGLQLKSFKEYDYSPYNCLNGMTEFEPGKFRLKKFGDKVPMVYSLVAEKI